MIQSMYKVKITGKDVKRFIKKIYNSGVFINEIEIYSKYAYLKLDKRNYNKLLSIKTIYEIKIIRLYGIAKYIEIIRNNFILLICIFIGFIYFVFLSNIIFEVDVIHSKKEIRNLVYNQLKAYGIEKFNYIKSYNKKEYIESKILENNKDKIEWIDIERIGVKYVVRVEERIIKKKNNNPAPRNIVAKKDGIIMKIETSKGEILKKKGDYVKKGDIIVSGIITKNDEIKNQVASYGRVYAEVWYKTNVNFPYYYSEINYLGEKRNKLKIRFLNRDYYLFDFNRYNSYNEKILFSLDNYIIPISLIYAEEEKTNKIEKVLSHKEAIKEAKLVSTKKLKEFLNDEAKILDQKILKVNEYENYVNIIAFYKVYEEIGVYKDILKEQSWKNDKILHVNKCK